MMAQEDFEPVSSRDNLPTQYAAFKRREAPSADLSIAAIIPLYNGAKYIEQAIDSVLAQTMLPAEVIVVDDGSTDDGPAIVTPLAEKHPITLLRKPNGGQSSARNYGVAHSTSTLIAFLDQDDGWYPDHLETLLRPFLVKRGVPLGWVYSNLDEVDESGQMVTKRLLDHFSTEHPKRTLISALSNDMFVLPSASLISRDAFESIRGFDERLSGYEDDDLFLRIFRAGFDNTYINKPLSKWRIYPSSCSYTYRMARSRMTYAKKLLAMFPPNPEQSRYFGRDCIAPRFIRQTLGDCHKAIRLRDKKMLASAAGDLRELRPYARRRLRLLLTLIAPMLANLKTTSLMYQVRAAYRRVFA